MGRIIGSRYAVVDAPQEGCGIGGIFCGGGFGIGYFPKKAV